MLLSAEPFGHDPANSYGTCLTLSMGVLLKLIENYLYL